MTTPSAYANPKCPACGADVDSGAARCGRCGTSLSLSSCPHCQATAGISKNAEFRYVCDVCGGPRVPSARSSGKRGGREDAGLAKAEAARRGRAKGRAVSAGAIVGFLFLTLPFVLFWVIWGLGLFSALAYGAMSVPFAALYLWGAGKAKREGKAIPPALDEAWLGAAGEVLAASGHALSPGDLAAALGTEESHAEELLAMMDVQRSVGHRIGQSDAMAAFDAKLRVATQNKAQADAGALEREAQAEQEAQEAAVQKRKASSSQK